MDSVINRGLGELILLCITCLAYLKGVFFSIFPGSLWSLVGAMLYAVYIVMIKRKVDREDKLDIPMFFGKTKSNSVERFNSMCDSMICFQALHCV